MKRKVLTTVCVTLIMFTFSIFYCDQSSINPSNNENGSPLVGTWKSTTGTGKLVITSSITQTVFDMFSQGAGALTVTGAHSAVLNYLFAISADFLFALNQQFTPGEYPEKAELPLYVFSVMGPGASYQVKTSETDSTMYMGSTTGLDYDSTSHTLTASNVQLTSQDQQTVTVNGTLSNKSVNAPANTPTEVLDMTDMMEEDQITMTLIINENQTFTTIMLEDGEPDTSSGTWSVNGDKLTIIDEIDDGGQAVYDTTEATYSLNGNNLTLTMDQNICNEDELDDGETKQECMMNFEQILGMQKNSLVEPLMRITLNLAKQ